MSQKPYLYINIFHKKNTCHLLFYTLFRWQNENEMHENKRKKGEKD